MRKGISVAILLLATIAVLLLTWLLMPRERQPLPVEEPEKPKPRAAPGPAVTLPAPTPPLPAVPLVGPVLSVGPFVEVPAGALHPGCTWKDLGERVLGNPRLKQALQYDVWGSVPPSLVQVPAFGIGKFEVSNAQWKAYLDANFRITHTCDGHESLEDLAVRYVKFRGEGVRQEWRAIYALNHRAIRNALDLAKLWLPEWPAEDPDPDRHGIIGRLTLPKGIALVIYGHRVPRHWYGWCKLSGLSSGREYCNPSLAPREAFRVPDGAVFRRIRKLRADDFANHPVRDLSGNEMLAFAEWFGCHLPSEYEWERAARGDRPNTAQFTGDGIWNHREKPDPFPWSGNPLCRNGPLPIDDARVWRSDSPFGVRNMLGNVWELTRTFFDFHPRVAPKPPEPSGGIFNFTLTAKGGSYGDQWPVLQISTRTGELGAILDISNNNRAASLGLRLVRHPQPGHDLLLHSILRLSYLRSRAAWDPPLPHAYALPRMAGIDSVRLKEGRIRLRQRAQAVAFAPLWVCDLTERRLDGDEPVVLGVLRSDIPLLAQVHGKEKSIDPGEWVVSYKSGSLVLGRALVPIGEIRRVREEATPATMEAEPRRSRIHLRFRVEEQADPKRPQDPPDQLDSEMWALCEVHPQGWPRDKSDFCWEVAATLHFGGGSLSRLMRAR
ncbi:MAG: formylglycine-generating enzyme family protein [Planctomycetota bacterium]|jgi:formylglycine-generating enzyme required for sulfatase activity